MLFFSTMTKYNHTNPEPRIKAAPTSISCSYAKMRFQFLSVFFLGGDVMYYDDYYTFYTQRTQLIDVSHGSVRIVTGKSWMTWKSGFHLTFYLSSATGSFSRNKMVGTRTWLILPSSFTVNNVTSTVVANKLSVYRNKISKDHFLFWLWR